MTDEIKRNWVNAAAKLGKDKNEKVICPSCNIGILQVKDEPIYPWKKIDRYLLCTSCGQWNVMTGNFPDSEFYFKDETS